MSLHPSSLHRATNKPFGKFLPVVFMLLSLVAGTAQAQIDNPIPEVVPWSDVTLVIEYFTQIPASSGSYPKTRIVHLKPAGDGSGRLFVNDLNGKMHLVSQGAASLYLDLKAQTPAFKSAPGLGTGFTSFSFHPEFATNGKLYTSHTENPGSATPDFGLPNTSDSVALQGVITEWTATDPTADVFAGTRRELLRADLSGTIHGFQEIEFNLSAKSGDADYGMLFICIGDGGSTIGGYPENTSRLDSHQGTILRIDPMGTNSANGNYGVPADNPWASDGDPDTFGEIWAYGFRNAHRITWDTGGDHKMLTATIGERNIEEINLVEPGNHYGWNHREGTFVINSEWVRHPENGTNYDIFPLPDDDDSYGYTYPVAQYDHDEGVAIAGGYIYRGASAPNLVGKYLFGEIVDGVLYFVEADDLVDGSQAPIQKFLLELDGNPTTMLSIIGRSRTDIRFGYDEDNELYITEKQHGKIYKIVDARVPTDPLIGGTPVDGLPGWYLSEWFGYYNTALDPWIFHDQHGWLYREPSSTNASTFFYDDVMTAWWYTTETDYPYIYVFDAPADNDGTVAGDAWLWYFEETKTPRSFGVVTGAEAGNFLYFNP